MEKNKNIKKKKFYIATAIAYTNAVPHIGHVLEYIQADTIARYYRKTKDVFFLTGSDEHGDKVNRAAIVAGKEPKEFVDGITKEFKGLKKEYNLSYDDYIRTTDKKRHYPAVYALFEKLQKKGDIYIKDYEGKYCIGCEKFLTEKDLDIDGNCPIHKKAPEMIREQNYFFRLSRYENQLRELIESGKMGIYPNATKSEMLAFLNQGLEDISFSRSKKSVPWGIPIKGSNQTMYVWGDALVNYISAIGYGWDEENFKKLWPAEVQLIGKDISRFHCLIWQAMLISAGLKNSKNVFVHGYITVNGEKMSKSIGNVVNAYEPAKRFGIDPLRYYVLREIPSDGDGDFSYERLSDRYERDLARGLGNFVSRTLNLINGEKIDIAKNPSKEVKDEIKRMKARVEKGFEEFRLHEALSAVFDFIKAGDVYVNDKQPWKNKSPKISRDLLAFLENIGEYVEPFMPDTSKKILSALKYRENICIPKKIEPLFPLQK